MTRVLTYILTKDKSKNDYVLLSELCHNSKNLYNYVNYIVRQAFAQKSENIEDFKDLIENERFISEYALSGRLAKMKQTDYVSLKAQCSQQVIKQVYYDWKSFFKAVKEYKANKSKFKGCPKLPKYKDKNGQNVLTYTNQSCSFDKKTGCLKIAKNISIESVRLPDGISKFNQVSIIPKNEYFQIEVVYEKGVSDYVETAKRTNMKQHSAGIDIGVDNLATVTSDNPALKPIIVNGRCVKSVNQFYNKKLASLKAKYSRHGRRMGKKSRKLALKRKLKVDDYFHKVSRMLVSWCIENNVGNVFVGHNPGWKQEVKMGKINNQNFIQIPFERFVSMLRYKLEEVGIALQIVNEAYTSKCSALDNEEISKHDVYLGKRVKRGLFKTSAGKLVNADVNGSLNILRRGLGHDFEIGKVVFNPIKLKHESRNASARKPASRGSVLDSVGSKDPAKESVKIC